MREGSLEVDGSEAVIERSSAKLRSFNTDAGLYIGKWWWWWPGMECSIEINFPYVPLLQFRWNAKAGVLHATTVQDRNNWMHLGSGAGRRVAA